MVQVVANVFQWSKLQNMVERSFLVHEFLQSRPAAHQLALQPATTPDVSPAAPRTAPNRRPQQQQRHISAFARKHSVSKATAMAAEEAALVAAAPSKRSAAAVAEQVQQAAEMALGGKLTRSQPLVDAGMDSLGALPVLPNGNKIHCSGNTRTPAMLCIRLIAR